MKLTKTISLLAISAMAVVFTSTAKASISNVEQIIYVKQCDEPSSPDVSGSAISIDSRSILPSLSADGEASAIQSYEVENWALTEKPKYKVIISHTGSANILRTSVALEDENGNRLAETFLQAKSDTEHAFSATLKCDRDPKHMNKFVVGVLQRKK